MLAKDMCVLSPRLHAMSNFRRPVSSEGTTLFLVENHRRVRFVSVPAVTPRGKGPTNGA